MIYDDKFIVTNQQYNSGIMLDEYNGVYSLSGARLGQDRDGNEKVWQDWGFRQTKDKKPMEKAMPWKITIGTKDEAIQNLKDILSLLGAEYDGPEKFDGTPADSGDNPEFDKIPF
jgi:hypothetical protein